METRTNRKQIQVSIADTRESREACFRLRYQVYVDEMGYSEDAPRQMLCDALDDTGVIFQATQDGKTVGTLRMNFAKDCPSEYQQRYSFSLLTGEELSSAVVVTKLMVAKEFRHSRVLLVLLNCYYEYCLENGIENNLIACSDQLLGLYGKLGFVPQGDVYTHPVYGKSTPMIARTFDYEHMSDVGSPFAARLGVFRESVAIAA